MRSNLLFFAWILPFISFLGGYQLLRFFDRKEVISAPKVIGQNINDAIKTLSSYKLNVRILNEKEDLDIPDGTIISQTPQEGQKVKSGQSIFLVITRKPANPTSLCFFGQNVEESKDLARSKNINLKAYSIENIAPIDTCIAQSVLPDQQINDTNLIIYTSSGTNQIRILPNFKGYKLDEVKTFLEKYDIKFQLTHNNNISDESHTCTTCNIIDQRPLPGAFFDLSKDSSIQLILEENSNHF